MQGSHPQRDAAQQLGEQLDLLERWPVSAAAGSAVEPLSDAARLALIALLRKGSRPGDLFEIVHRRPDDCDEIGFFERIGRRDERSSRRAFERLLELHLVERVFDRKGRHGRTIYRMGDPLEVYRRQAAGRRLELARTDPQLRLSFEQVEQAQIEDLGDGVLRLRLFSGGENAAESPHLPPPDGLPKCGDIAAFSASHVGKAAISPHLAQGLRAADDGPQEDFSRRPANHGRAPGQGGPGDRKHHRAREKAATAAARGDRSRDAAIGGSGPSEGPGPLTSAAIGTASASRAPTPTTARVSPSKPTEPTPTPNDGGARDEPSRLGQILDAVVEAGDGELGRGFEAAAHERRREIYLEARRRLVQAVRRAEKARQIEQGDRGYMRGDGSWPCGAFAHVLSHDASGIGQQDLEELLDDVAHRAKNPGGFVTSRYNRLVRERIKPDETDDELAAIRRAVIEREQRRRRAK